MLIVASLCSLSSCSDDDNYSAATGNVVSSVETGDATVTAISAQITGKVLDLSHLDASSYTVGVVYGTTPYPTTSGKKQSGTLDADGNVTTTLSGLTKGTTYYYATYVELQGIVTKYGEVKSFVATDAQISTAEATDLTSTKATLSATVDGVDGVLTEEKPLNFGFKLSISEENVQNGLDYPVVSASKTVSKQLEGLLPGTTYYYTSYFELGGATVYGETKSFTTPEQQMEYVDLGLSVEWAKCNLGAETEEATGTLFGYGDQTGLIRSTYLTDYNVAADIAGTANDFLANVKIDKGSSLKSSSPTANQIAELVKNTKQEESEVNGVKGVKFTSKLNGNSIFMPYAGYRDGTEKVGEGTEGLYWSGNNYSVATDYSQTLKIASGEASSGVSARNLGLAVRPVRQYSGMSVDNSKLSLGDKEHNSHL